MIDNIVKLKDYVPLFQSVLWIILLSLLLIIFRRSISKLIVAFEKRIGKGSSVKIGPIELGEDIKNLEYVDENKGGNIVVGADAKKREDHRHKIYENNNRIFLAHILLPIEKNRNEYEIFIYLIGHKNRKMDDIEKAEFFFGHMWGNKIFLGSIRDGVIGVRTSAYGPFLCTCCVKLKTGQEIILDRYIDFEMGKIVRNLTIAST
jgi:hypothetical protein